MQSIPINQITINPRQRKTIDKTKLKELSDSIFYSGLLHPIILQLLEGKFILIAGERRLRAVASLHENSKILGCNDTLIIPGEIPYTLLNSDFDEIKIREVELEENLIRQDITWQEKITALNEIHAIKKARNPKQTILATAKTLQEPNTTLKYTTAKLKQAELLSNFLDDPEVMKAKNVAQAEKIVYKKLEADLINELNKRNLNKVSKHQLLHAPFQEVFLNNNFSCVIADPPYGINADKFGNGGTPLIHKYQDTLSEARKLNFDLINIAFNATNDKGFLFLFCDIEMFLTLREYAKFCNWLPFRTPLIWNKQSNKTNAPWQDYGFRRNYEFILFARKKNSPVFSKIPFDVLWFSPAEDKQMAAEKPVELYKRLLSLTCLPGDSVLDPTCGTGTIFEAAESLKLIATGIEKDDETFKLAQVRLHKLKD